MEDNRSIAKTKFQKKNRGQIVSIPGTKPSIHNSQLLTSTGVATFDAVIGGGIPVGSIVLVEEDKYNVYCNLLLKFYLAEGIYNDHFVHLISMDDDPYNILHSLPTHCVNEDKNCKDEEKLNIAWRYKNMSTFSLAASHSLISYDLNKFIDVSKVDSLASIWKGDETSLTSCTENLIPLSPLLNSILQNIKLKIKENNVLVEHNKATSNLLRIGISSLLSPFWGQEYIQQDKEIYWNDITLFLTLLKSIIRSSFCTVMITLPSHLISDQALIARLYGIVDVAIKLESFHGSDKEINPIFQDCHGLLYIKKVASLNSLVPYKIESLEWAFQLKKKYFIIKRLHLPPNLSETVSRTSGDSKKQTASCVGDSLPKHLDF